MQNFYYRSNELYAEQVPVKQLAEKYGTPLYVYSKNTIIDKAQQYQTAFADTPHNVCYALKANSNFNIIKLMASIGCGADIVSGGELYLALKAGIPANKIVYASVGKTDDEIRQAIDAGICAFNVESPQELDVIDEYAVDVVL